MGLSSRTEFDSTPNALARLLAELSIAGETILDLTDSNPTRCGFDYPPEILEAMGERGNLIYDPAPLGMRRAREAVAAVRPAVDPDHVVLTASTSEAYAWLFKLLCEPGEEILVPTPSYPLFEFIARLEGVRLVSYPLVYEDRWQIDFGEIERRIGSKTRGLIVVHPNNPTGSYLDNEEIDRLHEVCSRERIPIVSDEVFFDYPLVVGAHPHQSLSIGDGPLTFVLGGLSKQVGLPQMKLSWILVSGPEEERREALSRIELIGDTFLSVGTPIQRGLDQVLDLGVRVRSQILRRIRGNLRSLRRARGDAASWEVLRVEGGWTVVLRLPRIVSDEEWALSLLREDHLLVQPGYFYDFASEGHLVLSLLPEPGRFEEGVRRIASRIAARAG